MISRVTDENDISRIYITCLGYTILVQNPQYIVKIYHSGGFFPTTVVYLYNDIEGYGREWCISNIYNMLGIYHSGPEPSVYSQDIPFWRVFSDHNGISLQWYQGFQTRMIYLDDITCLGYTTLVQNPRYIVKVYHSGREPRICNLCSGKAQQDCLHHVTKWQPATKIDPWLQRNLGMTDVSYFGVCCCCSVKQMLLSFGQHTRDIMKAELLLIVF